MDLVRDALVAYCRYLDTCNDRVEGRRDLALESFDIWSGGLVARALPEPLDAHAVLGCSGRNAGFLSGTRGSEVSGGGVGSVGLLGGGVGGGECFQGDDVEGGHAGVEEVREVCGGELFEEREAMRVVLGGSLEGVPEVREVDMSTGLVMESSGVEEKKKKYKSPGRDGAIKAVLNGEKDMSTLTEAQRRKVEKKLASRAQKSLVSGSVSVGVSGVSACTCERERESVEVGKVDGVVSASGGNGSSDKVPEWRRTAAAPVVQREKDSLRESLERKWKAKNALEAKKAERELMLLEGEDIEAVKGLREKKVRVATEKAMVQMEKVHASLAAAGNVPGLQPGFCETVVDGEVVSGSATRVCSISPSSSISWKEVRQMQKTNADQEKRIAELEARNSDLTNTLDLYKRGEKVDAQVERMYCESVPVTVDSEGEVPADVMWKAGNKYEGKEFMEVGPLVNGKRTVKFDRYAFSRSGAYSKDYEAFDSY